MRGLEIIEIGRTTKSAVAEAFRNRPIKRWSESTLPYDKGWLSGPVYGISLAGTLIFGAVTVHEVIEVANSLTQGNLAEAGIHTLRAALGACATLACGYSAVEMQQGAEELGRNWHRHT